MNRYTLKVVHRLIDAAYDFTDLPILVGEEYFYPIAFFDRGNTQAVLFAGNAEHFLIFPGTASIADFFTDMTYAKTDWPMGGRVHLGFADGFNAVSQEINKALLELDPRPLIIGGHSLGGSMALLAGTVFGAFLVVTLGAPKTGNAAFVAALERRCPVDRVETQFDPVTFVPPAVSPVPALYALAHGRMPTAFQHAGERFVVPAWGHGLSHYGYGIDKIPETGYRIGVG